MLKLIRKAYFWLFIILNILYLASLYYFPEMDSEPPGLSDYLEWITLPFGVVALFGYAYERYLYKQYFWIVIVVVIIGNEVVFGLWYAFITIFEGLDSHQWKMSDLWLIVGVYLLFVPYWIGIIKYAFNKQYWLIR